MEVKLILALLCSQVVNDLVFSGSSDQCVYTHNIHVSLRRHPKVRREVLVFNPKSV